MTFIILNGVTDLLAVFGPEQPGADGLPDTGDEETSTYRLTDVTQVHRGFEFDLEYRPLAASWSLTGYGSIGNWKYDGTTPYTLQNDETGDFVVTNGEADITDVKVGNAPQTSFGFGVDVDLAENLSVDMRYNIYTDLYEFVDVKMLLKLHLQVQNMNHRNCLLMH